MARSPASRSIARRELARRVGRGDEAVLAVADELEHSARVGAGQHRPPRLERLDGDVAVVLVERRVVDGERPRVELDQPLVVDAAQELDALADAELAREALQPLALGPVAGDDATHLRARRGDRPNQLVEALHRIEPADREDVVAEGSSLR